jgi:hypothetical protein
MNEIEIYRLNIRRFRQLLDAEPDGVTRQLIEDLLHEFEDKLAASTCSGGHAPNGNKGIRQVSPHYFSAN